jgi:hypothetical protein
VARRGRDERGRRWCEGMSAGRPAFTAAEGGRGSAMMSMVATSLRGAEWMAMMQRGWRGPGGDAGPVVVKTRRRRGQEGDEGGQYCGGRRRDDRRLQGSHGPMSMSGRLLVAWRCCWRAERARGGVGQRGDVTLWHAPVRVRERPGMCWASLGACVLAHVVLSSVDGVYPQVQESERKVADTVVHDGKERREEGHGVCHVMHGMVHW